MPPAETPLRWAALSLPRQGNTAAEYEDAWSADSTAGRFAVADGASESAFADLWARLLAEGFVAAERPRDLAGWLGAARGRWSAGVMGLELPWYIEAKRDEGAFATLLGLGVRCPPSGWPARWRAVAVGDSCLMQVRGDGRVRAFPVGRAADFDNQPPLIGSRGTKVPAARRCSGSLLPGDRLFLMTDALAQWFLGSHESGGRPAEALAALLFAERPQAAFAAWIEGRRTDGALRDDDVTLLGIELGSSADKASGTGI